jgi:uncharacterized protein (DUF2141 family)
MRGWRLAVVLAAAGVPTAAVAQDDCTGPPGPVRLYVDVHNVRSSTGLVAVTLYADDPSRFLRRRGSLYVGRVPARAGTTRVCIHLPATGVYALGVYHDADADRRYDRNAIGLPSEGYGFSNDAPAIFGLPSFRSVRLQVPRSGFETRVRMRYP